MRCHLADCIASEKNYLLRVRGPNRARLAGSQVDASGELVGELLPLGAVGEVAEGPASQSNGLVGSKMLQNVHFRY
jgi:hypothetical protein